MEDVRIKLLELNCHKYLQYKIITILLFFSYIIAILIPFFTGDLKANNFYDMFLLLVFSFFVISMIILSLNEFNYHLKRIPEEIKK